MKGRKLFFMIVLAVVAASVFAGVAAAQIPVCFSICPTDAQPGDLIYITAYDENGEWIDLSTVDVFESNIWGAALPDAPDDRFHTLLKAGDELLNIEIIDGSVVFELTEVMLSDVVTMWDYFGIPGGDDAAFRIVGGDGPFGTVAEAIAAGGTCEGVICVDSGNTTASVIYPEDEAIDVHRDVILSWKPGIYPGTHNVYFGTDFNDVNDGTALMSENQSDTTYDVGRLEFGQIYYWRIDEVNDSADATVYRGNVWSFTAEAFAIKIPSGNITASASSHESEEFNPENTIDESGLDPNDMDLHSTSSEAMWLTDDANAAEPAWIQFDFDKVYKLHQMLVWNYNGQFVLTGFGIQDVNIEYSEDGQTWTQLSSTTQLERAPGTEGYKYNTTVDFGGLAVKSVRINALTKWGGAIYPQSGLSEVRFMAIPVRAREPYPDMDENDIPIDVTLSWREGREADQHIVSFSTDQQAVSEGNAVVDTVGEASYSPLPLDIAKVYYWRIDEVNNAETPTTWIGDTWSFRSQDYLIVDDFEGYDDDEPNRIWDIWSDGWDDNNNGSTVGYPDPDFDAGEHFVETDIVHGGEQSGPILYDNTSADYSEVSINTTDLPIGRTNWTVGSPETFVLWFLGDLNNETTDQLYVKLGDTKKVYDGDVADIARTAWTKFEVPLAGMDISDISSLKIGIEKTGATGGDGILYVDDIQLTFLVPATDPGTDNLIALYDMENNLVDGSGSGFDGTFFGGDPNYVSGEYGMALALDGNDDYVELPIGETISTLTSCTISSRVNWSGSGGGDQWERVFDFGSGTADNIYLTTRSGFTSMRSAIKAGDGAEDQAIASPRLSTGNWEHLAVVIDAANMTMTLYRNGDAASDTSLQYLPKDLGVTTQNWLGRSQWPDPYFEGMLDDFRIYDKALSAGEIRYIYEN
jgi:hypothetical protein